MLCLRYKKNLNYTLLFSSLKIDKTLAKNLDPIDFAYLMV